jgi:hypothetical protein
VDAGARALDLEPTDLSATSVLPRMRGGWPDDDGANAMRARIGMDRGLYLAGIVQLAYVIVMIGELGTIGAVPALLSALTKYARPAFGAVRRELP